MQMKTTKSHHCTWLRTASKDLQSLSAAEGEGNREPSHTVGRALNGWVRSQRKIFGGSLKHEIESFHVFSNSTPCFHLEKNPNSKEYVHFYFQGSTIHNNQVRVLTKISIDRKMKTNWPIYTVEYTQKIKILGAAAWMYREIITLRYETKDKHPKILLTGGSQKFMQMK